MTFIDALRREYRTRPLRTVALSVLTAFAATVTIATWIAFLVARQSANEDARVVSELRRIREWPVIQLRSLGNAAARLRTTCETSGPVGGNFRFDLVIDHPGEIEQRVHDGVVSVPTFRLVFYDADGFKVDDIAIPWSQFVRVLNDSGQIIALKASDGSSMCSYHLRDWQRWNLTYSLPGRRAER